MTDTYSLDQALAEAHERITAQQTEIDRLRRLLQHIADYAEFSEESHKDWRGWIDHNLQKEDE